MVNFHYGAKAQVDSIWGNGLLVERRYLDATTGRIDSVRYNNENERRIYYTYDAQNRLIKYRDPVSHETAYHYDPVFGNVDTVT